MTYKELFQQKQNKLAEKEAELKKLLDEISNRNGFSDIKNLGNNIEVG